MNAHFAIHTAPAPCMPYSDQLLPEAELVHGDGEVARLVVAVVQVAVVHGDQVHVAEDEAVVLGILQSLCIAHVKQLGSVEGVFAELEDNIKPEIAQRSGSGESSWWRLRVLFS